MEMTNSRSPPLRQKQPATGHLHHDMHTDKTADGLTWLALPLADHLFAGHNLPCLCLLVAQVMVQAYRHSGELRKIQEAKLKTILRTYNKAQAFYPKVSSNDAVCWTAMPSPRSQPVLWNKSHQG
jgi:hypothetical protein